MIDNNILDFPEFSIIKENYKLLIEAEMNNKLLVLNEDEQKQIEASVKKFVDEAYEYYNNIMKSSQQLVNESKLWALLSTGVLLLGFVVSLTSTSSALALIAMILFLLSLVGFIFAGAKLDKATEVLRQLTPLRKKLEIQRNRTKDVNLQDKINSLIFTIEDYEKRLQDTHELQVARVGATKVNVYN